jgi:type II secretory pathway predicted ATPase ExeA
MYLTHFGLTHYPFERDLQPDELFASTSLREAHARLNLKTAINLLRSASNEGLVVARAS